MKNTKKHRFAESE